MTGGGPPAQIVCWLFASPPQEPGGKREKYCTGAAPQQGRRSSFLSSSPLLPAAAAAAWRAGRLGAALLLVQEERQEEEGGWGPADLKIPIAIRHALRPTGGCWGSKQRRAAPGAVEKNSVREKMAQFIHEVVLDWSDRYVYHLEEIPNAADDWCFKTTWSIPSQVKPVPKAVCYITFRVIPQPDNGFPLVQYKSAFFIMPRLAQFSHLLLFQLKTNASYMLLMTVYHLTMHG